MGTLRRLILAAALMAGFTPAFGQAPPAVPALPDTERRTSYSLTASTCACAVNFALYGDSTDYANWLEVWVNGVRVPQAGNWTITSPTGSLASISRPVTDAVLTFTTAQTGTVQIVGARRPRRAVQFVGQPSARDFNLILTDIIAQNRETWDKTNDVTGRAILAPPGETLNILAAAATRANTVLGFDALGQIGFYSPASAVTAASNVNFLQAGTGAVSRTVQDELRDTIKASQFGLACDGATSDSAAVQRAVTYADSVGGKTVLIDKNGSCPFTTDVFLNKWTVPGTLTVPGLKIKGQGKDVTKIDARNANGYVITVNPDWKAAFQALSGIAATTGGSGALATNTYYVQITMNDPGGNEVRVTLPASIAVTGPTGRISITLPAVHSGYSFNIYLDTASTPAHYAIIGGNNASAIGGNQTLLIDAIGSARAVPTDKVPVWQNAEVSDLSITNTTSTANASGVMFFQAGYAGLANVRMAGLTGNGFDIPNYTGDIDGSFNISVSNSKFDTISGTCINAAGLRLELSNFLVKDTQFNLCGTLPANYNTNFTISAISNANPGVVTTTGSHTLAANDQIYIQNLAGGTFSTLNSAWYRVCPTATQAVTATTFGLCNIGGGTVDTTALGSYTASSGTESLSWRPPTAASNSGALVWMGLIGTFRNLDFTQNKNFSMYFTENGTSDNATIEGVDFENTYGKGLYIAALAGGTLSNFECLSTAAIGATVSCVQLGTGFNAGGVQNFNIGPGKVRSDVTPTVGFELFQNTNNGAAFADTVRLLSPSINWQLFDAAGQTRTNGFTFDPVPGQASFSISALNTAKLSPSGSGAALPMHLKTNGEWIAYKVPAAGITKVVGPLSATTTYNCYAFNSAATSAPALADIECNTTATATVDGYLTKSGDATRTFIGTARTDGAGAFQTSGAQTSQYPGTVTSASSPLLLSSGSLSCPTCVLIAATAHGNSDYSILSTDRYVYTNAAFTAPRVWTLPAANSLTAGTTIWVQDAQNTATSTNTLTISRAGADTINVGSTSVVISGAGGGLTFTTDGVSNWGTPVQTVSTGGTGRTALTNHGVLVGAAANPITQLAVGSNGTFLAGATGADPAFVTMSQDCTMTAAGVMTCTKTNNVSFGNYATLSAGQLTNSLAADVNLNNTANYFDGPSVAQGTSGTWFASGSVTLTGASADQIFCKLWDGTTVIATGQSSIASGLPQTMALSGYLATPAGNIRISCRDPTGTTGKIVFNSTTLGKDATISAFRIN